MRVPWTARRSNQSTKRGRLRPRTKHSLQELPHIRGQGQKPGGTHARGAVAKRSYPKSEVRGSSQECQAVMARQLLRGATPSPRSGAVAGRSYPTSKERWLRWRRRAKRSYSMFKVGRDGCEEIPLLQGKEQWLHFAGAAVKGYPMSKIRETQVRR